MWPRSIGAKLFCTTGTLSLEPEVGPGPTAIGRDTGAAPSLAASSTGGADPVGNSTAAVAATVTPTPITIQICRMFVFGSVLSVPRREAPRHQCGYPMFIRLLLVIVADFSAGMP
jgi:hypothetical protein